MIEIKKIFDNVSSTKDYELYRSICEFVKKKCDESFKKSSLPSELYEREYIEFLRRIK